MKIAIFDMDGTLIDSGSDITHSVNHVRDEIYSLKPLSVKYIVDAINAPKRNLAKLFYETELYEEGAQELFEGHYYDQCIQNVRLYDGVIEMLELLRVNDVKLSVATNAPSIFARRMLTYLHVDDFFDHIIGADMVEAPKPDAQMLKTILEHYNFNDNIDAAWMIGDNSKDMLSAKNAQIDSIFARWGFSRDGEGMHSAEHPKHVGDIISAVSRRYL